MVGLLLPTIASQYFIDMQPQSLKQVLAAPSTHYKKKVMVITLDLLEVQQAVQLTAAQPTLVQEDLYFGRNIGTTGQVSEQQFRQFLKEEITPRFPDGLTVYNAKGQFLDSSEQLIREPSKVVSLVFEDTQKNHQAINEIISTYKYKFQ
jgi:hypothetical protein